MNNILDYLNELYPDPKSELNSNNDFEFLIAVVLSAQTTDKKVNKVTKELFNIYDINSLASASNNDIERIIKPLSMSNKKSIYIINIAKDIINKYNYLIPNNMTDLLKLSGVGRKTANVILSHLFNIPCMPVDTHILRVSKRLGLTNINDNAEEVEMTLVNKFPKDSLAVLHKQLVLFGRYHCTARKPNCRNCKLIDMCKYEKKND